MARARVLTLIMAGGSGGRMEVLTERRAKPALPFGGVYHLIDFPLSNCMHSGLENVWVVEQYEPFPLNEHLANGRPWDLDRTYGGLRLLQPRQGRDGAGFHGGNADALYKNRDAIRAYRPDVVLVLSADHVYKLDYRAVVDAHRERDADVTMVTTRVPLAEAGRFGTVQADARGRVTDFEYKPDPPGSDLVTTEVFAYEAGKLLDTLEAMAAEQADDADGQNEEGRGEEPSLGDYGDDLVPRLVRGGQAYEYRFEGYWRDVGTIDSYWQAHMDLLRPEPGLALDERSWPILARGVQRLPARIETSARIDASLISPGCAVRGRVERSVLGPGVTVEEGATVRDAILLGDGIVAAGATVDCAILDLGVRVASGATVGEPRGEDDARPSPDDIALVGQGAEVPPGRRVEAGGRVSPAD